MSTTAGRKKAPIPDSGTQTSRRNQEKKPGQEELFTASDYSRKTYTPLSETGGDTDSDTPNVEADASDAEAGGEGGGLQPSSRATRLRAREAAVEAMNFPGKKTEPEADKPKAAGKSGTSDKPKAAEKSKAAGKPATGKPKKVSDARKQTGTTKRKPAVRKPAARESLPRESFLPGKRRIAGRCLSSSSSGGAAHSCRGHCVSRSARWDSLFGSTSRYSPRLSLHGGGGYTPFR